MRGLRQVEVDGPAQPAHGGELLLQLAHELEVVAQELPGRDALSLEDAGHLGVGAAGRAPHDCRVDLGAERVALRVDAHVGHHAQPLHLRVEGADAVGEPLRQHGEHLHREVHARPAPERLGVQGRAGADVVGDVGDGHDQPVAAPLLAVALQALHVHGVVEVASVLAVDGDEPEPGEVAPPLPVLGPDAVGDGPGLQDHLLGEEVREALRVGDPQHLDAGLPGSADALHHRARELARGLDRDLDRLAVPGEPRLGNGHDPLEGAVGRDDEALTPPRVVRADEQAAAPLHHLDDAPHGAAARPGDDLDADEVPVERLGRLVGRDEQVLAGAVHPGDEPEAVAVARERPEDAAAPQRRPLPAGARPAPRPPRPWPRPPTGADASAKRLPSRRSTPSRVRSRSVRFTSVRSPGWMRARCMRSPADSGRPFAWARWERSAPLRSASGVVRGTGGVYQRPLDRACENP